MLINDTAMINSKIRMHWQAYLYIMQEDGQEVFFQALSPADQNRILLDISTGHLGGYCSSQFGMIRWMIQVSIHDDDHWHDFEDLTDAQREEIRWKIARDDEWTGTIKCTKDWR